MHLTLETVLTAHECGRNMHKMRNMTSPNGQHAMFALRNASTLVTTELLHHDPAWGKQPVMLDTYQVGAAGMVQVRTLGGLYCYQPDAPIGSKLVRVGLAYTRPRYAPARTR